MKKEKKGVRVNIMDGNDSGGGICELYQIRGLRIVNARVMTHDERQIQIGRSFEPYKLSLEDGSYLFGFTSEVHVGRKGCCIDDVNVYMKEGVPGRAKEDWLESCRVELLGLKEIYGLELFLRASTGVLNKIKRDYLAQKEIFESTELDL